MSSKNLSVDYQFDAILFGYDARIARENAGLAQHEAAEMMGVSQSQLSIWERGARDGLLLANFLTVCNTFDLHPGDYFCLSNTGARDAAHAARIRQQVPR
jgi:transcriptional regulator with XRE-family HTH domain